MPTRSLFHYQRYDSGHLRALLSERKIRLSRPDSFNDPWDCKVHYVTPKPDTPEFANLWKWLIQMNIKHAPELTGTEREARVATYMTNQTLLEQYHDEMSRQMSRAVAEKYRVYCLTPDPRSTLMWSHYAGAHSGICVEFDANVSPMRHADYVRYPERYPPYDLATTDAEPLLTKSSHWAYEHEWRLVAEERSAPNTWPESIKVDDGFLVLPPDVVRSVTIGCLADAARREEIASLVASTSSEVVVRQARVAPDQFELVIEPDFAS